MKTLIRAVSFFSMTKVALDMCWPVSSAGREEFREHAADAPAVMQLPRPWQLDVGLCAAPGDVDGAGRQRDAGGDREVDLPRHRADLPFDAGRDVGKAGCDQVISACPT